MKRAGAALRMTTEVLATELAAPSTTPPEWTAFEWRLASAAAAIHGVSALLATNLRWRGPERWNRFLDEQRTHMELRHRRIAQLLADIDCTARSAGIALVPLKGAALHDIGLYRAGERPMSDIDLLVGNNEVVAAGQLLRKLGYRQAFANWRQTVFEPETPGMSRAFGEHCGNPIKIELHTRIVERLPVVDRDITDRIFPYHAHAGANRYPSRAALMTHLLLHAAGDMCGRALRLIQLHDLALLARRMTAADWDEVLATGRPGWVSPPLTILAKYYGSVIPEDVLCRARGMSPWWLREACKRQLLADVSRSKLWIDAFPGIEWSNSPVEMLQFVARRLRPDTETLAVRSEIARTHPGAARSEWSHASQGRRALRWIFSRPARMETLTSVHAVLKISEAG